MGAEELDFLIRAVSNGLRVRFDPGLPVLHHRRGTFLSTLKQGWEASLTTNLGKTRAMSEAKYWYPKKDAFLACGFILGLSALMGSFVLGAFTTVVLVLIILLLAGNAAYYLYLRRSLGKRDSMWLAPIFVTASSMLRAVAITVGWVSRKLKVTS